MAAAQSAAGCQAESGCLHPRLSPLDPAAMPSDPDSSSSARARIRAAYSPSLLRLAGRRLSELLSDQLTRAQSSDGNVLNWNDPPANVAAADSFLSEPPSRAAPFAERGPDPHSRRSQSDEVLHRGGSGGTFADPQALADHFADLVQVMLSHGLNLHDPRYIGHQVPASIPIAGLFDAVGSVTNQVMAIYEMGPWASAVERALVDRLGELIGWTKGHFAGLITHGGSLANTTALLTARNIALGDSWENGVQHAGRAPVLVAHG